VSLEEAYRELYRQKSMYEKDLEETVGDIP
jgi:hypothetical protein